MRITRITAVALIAGAAAATPLAQAPAGQPLSPSFDAVSIRPTATGALGSTFNERPNGGFTMTNMPVTTLIGRAYAIGVPADWVGVPGWARDDRYDVSATASLQRASVEDRRTMMRVMLADRFRLIVRVEPREQEVYHLVLARRDGSLGPGLTRSAEDVDCEARTAQERAAREAAVASGQPAPPAAFPDLNALPPPCRIFTRGAGIDAHVNIGNLASFLRGTTGRPVVDRTGLRGLYRVRMEYDRLAGIRGPAVVPNPDGPPSVFTAVQEQLGLELAPARETRDTLVIERLERPSQN